MDATRPHGTATELKNLERRETLGSIRLAERRRQSAIGPRYELCVTESDLARLERLLEVSNRAANVTALADELGGQ